MTDHAHAHDHDSIAHPLPMTILTGVFLALMVLTVLTVAVTYVDLGPLNIWVALGIAVVKAGLVALYFMHLRYDAPFNGLILLCSFLFLAIFIGAAIGDSGEYQKQYVAPPIVQQTN